MERYKHLREKARYLRRKNMSLNNIQKRLKLSKTTIYYWIKDIKANIICKRSTTAKWQKRAVAAIIKKYKILRDNAYNNAWQNASTILKDLKFRDFVILYMAEGYRRNRNVVQITNSDPSIIALSNTCICALSKNKLYYKIQLHIDNNEQKEKEFWANLLNIKSEIIKVTGKSNSGKLSKRTWRSEHGVFAIATNDTYFRSALQAYMDFVKTTWKTEE